MQKRSKFQHKGQVADQGRAPETIGIDIGDRYCELCLLDTSCQVIARTKVKTTPAALRAYFQGQDPVRIALETGTHSGWISRLLEDCGHEVVVANARELRMIHQSNRKNDRADAEILARMAQYDPNLLSPVKHRSPAMQADIAMLRARDALVRMRTAGINNVRGLVKASGARLPKCSAETFARRVASIVPPELQNALGPVLETIANLTAQIREYDRRVEVLAQKRYPKSALLRQVAGVGPVTAVAFVLTIGDMNRFERSRDVGAYLGLVPRQYDSGDRVSQLRITKAGNGYLRRLLVGSAQYILGPFGPPCNLRRYGERIAQRGGKNAKRRAVVAVARKLAVLLHHLLSCATAYDPDYQHVPPQSHAA